MSLNDPDLGFFKQKSKVRVVSIALWCLVILLAFLTTWMAGVASTGTGGTAADRAPALPFLTVGAFTLGFGAMVFDFFTAEVRDDLAGWGATRFLGYVVLGLAAGACAFAITLGDAPTWGWMIAFVLAIGVLFLPQATAYRIQRREVERARVQSEFSPVTGTVTNMKLVHEMDVYKYKTTVTFHDDAGRQRWHVVRIPFRSSSVQVGDTCRVHFDPARLPKRSAIVVTFR